MTAPARTTGGTAVVRRDDASPDDLAIGSLPEPVRAALALRKQAGMVAAQIAAQNWGQKLDLQTRRAIAEYGRRFGIDVAGGEIEILGNRIYRTVQFYLRKLSELVEQGAVEYAYADHVHKDARLKDYPDEERRRAWERLQHGIPDQATGAVVFHIKMRAMAREVLGVNWCGGGTRKSDPVGDESPVKTAESRAARRAARLVASQIPGLRAQLEQADAVEEAMEAAIRSSHHTLRQQLAEQPRNRLVGAPPIGDEYGLPAPRSDEVAVVESRPVAALESGAAGADDYAAGQGDLVTAERAQLEARVRELREHPGCAGVRATDAYIAEADDNRLKTLVAAMEGAVAAHEKAAAQPAARRGPKGPHAIGQIDALDGEGGRETRTGMDANH